MGTKTSKLIKETPIEEKFAVNEAETSKTDIKTKMQYQSEMASSGQNVEKNLLETILGDSASTEDIRNLYIFDKKKVGRGHFGSVRRAKFICDSKRNYCVKTIVLQNLSADMYLLKRELEILRLMDHPNIIKFFDFYHKEDSVTKYNKVDAKHYKEKTEYLHFVMEHCSGGNLFEKLMREKGFDEDYTRLILFQIVYAVNHLHNRGICHRDLRLENFLIMSKSKQNIVKLADFGLAKMFSSSELKTKVGNYHYVAPEIFVLNGVYTPQVDAWSIGVMMYMMLTGEPPFQGSTPDSIFSSIKSGSYSTSQKVWDNVSPACKDLVKSLLETDPSKRIKVQDIMNHNWFNSVAAEYREIGSHNLKKDLLERFKSFSKMSKFQKEIVKLMVMVFHDYEEIEKLRYVFFFLDINCNGVLSVHDLKKFFNDFGEAVSEVDIEDLLKDLNLKFKNIITLTEFLAVTIEPFFIRDEKNIMAIYNRVRAQVPTSMPLQEESDSRSGVAGREDPLEGIKLKRPPELTGKSLRNSVNKFGLKITMEDFDVMLKEIRKDSKIDNDFCYGEFETAMKKIFN